MCWQVLLLLFCFFFFNDTATTEIYTLSLHDALPISIIGSNAVAWTVVLALPGSAPLWLRSEEHTSELQSHSDLVCRLLLEKKKKYSPHSRSPSSSSPFISSPWSACKPTSKLHGP